MRLTLCLLPLLALGCRSGSPTIETPGTDDGGTDDGGTDDGGSDDGGTDDGGTDDGGTDDGGDDGDPSWDCSVLPPIPVDYKRISGFTGAEDFAFDLEGNVVSVDENGNLLAQTYEADTTLLAAGVGYTAGTRYLPDGDLIIARVDRGTLIRVGPDGSKDTVITGLSYPNGVEVDAEGMVYVAEHDAGRVRRVDPDTGEYEIIAEGLTNPNGLRFSTDWNTLYVNSFGGGTVHAITRAEGEWTMELFGALASVDFEFPQPCDDKASGDRCTMLGGGAGTCGPTEADPEVLECTWAPETAACGDAALGDACTSTDIDGVEVSSVCAESLTGEELVCPVLEAERVSACEGKAEWTSCKLDSKTGYCVDSWEDVRVCVTQTEYNKAFQGTCTSSSEGDTCTSDYVASPWEGECVDYYGAIYCQPYGENWSDEGGLDGINVDECNNVYVTEYVSGKVWRFPEGGSPDGTGAEVVAELPSYWIPNARWGSGVGGWEKGLLYIMDRETGGIFELDLGLGGGDVAYQPSEGGE